MRKINIGEFLVFVDDKMKKKPNISQMTDEDLEIVKRVKLIDKLNESLIFEGIKVSLDEINEDIDETSILNRWEGAGFLYDIDSYVRKIQIAKVYNKAMLLYVYNCRANIYNDKKFEVLKTIETLICPIIRKIMLKHDDIEDIDVEHYLDYILKYYHIVYGYIEIISRNHKTYVDIEAEVGVFLFENYLQTITDDRHVIKEVIKLLNDQLQIRD